MIRYPIISSSSFSRAILTIVFLLLLAIVQGQSFEFANYLYQHKDFRGAGLEYKRCLINRDISQADSLYAIKRLVATLYLDSQREQLYHTSQLYYDLLIQDDYYYRYNALAMIKEGYYFPALSFMESAQHPQALIIRGLSHEYLGQSDEARRDIEDASKNMTDSGDVIQKLLTVNSDLKKLHHKSPYVAGALGVVPGAGYAYTGRYETAIASLVINLALLASSLELYKHDMKWSAGIVFSVFSGFYLGNIYGSASAAARDKYESTRKYLDTFITLNIDYFLDVSNQPVE